MKLKLWSDTILHLGTPWRSCEISFGVPNTRYRPVVMRGIATSRGFLGLTRTKTD